jgi:mRNA-degrading endonuclease toxin of MazEF toxin-antitoxin module
MRLFDVYFGYVQFVNLNNGKNRPVVVVGIDNVKKRTFLLPVYSHKKWFSKHMPNSLFEINDLASAGLNKKSYMNMAKIFVIDSSKLMNYTKIGHLAEIDIELVGKRLAR